MTKLIVAFRNFANAPKTRPRKLETIEGSCHGSEGWSPRRAGFNRRPFHMGFVVDKAALRYISLPVLRFLRSVLFHRHFRFILTHVSPTQI
jgi:hypothetical protein